MTTEEQCIQQLRTLLKVVDMKGYLNVVVVGRSLLWLVSQKKLK